MPLTFLNIKKINLFCQNNDFTDQKNIVSITTTNIRLKPWYQEYGTFFK